MCFRWPVWVCVDCFHTSIHTTGVTSISYHLSECGWIESNPPLVLQVLPLSLITCLSVWIVSIYITRTTSVITISHHRSESLTPSVDCIYTSGYTTSVICGLYGRFSHVHSYFTWIQLSHVICVTVYNIAIPPIILQVYRCFHNLSECWLILQLHGY